MENFLVNAVITATSNKVSEYETDRKTIYFRLVDEESQKTAKKMGLREYESKKGDKYSVVKASKEIAIFENEETTTPRVISGLISNGESKNPNFNSDDKIVTLNIIKGEHKNNRYFRLNAIMGSIKEVEKTNPFAQMSKVKAPDVDIEELLQSDGITF